MTLPRRGHRPLPRPVTNERRRGHPMSISALRHRAVRPPASGATAAAPSSNSTAASRRAAGAAAACLLPVLAVLAGALAGAGPAGAQGAAAGASPAAPPPQGSVPAPTPQVLADEVQEAAGSL